MTLRFLIPVLTGLTLAGAAQADTFSATVTGADGTNHGLVTAAETPSGVMHLLLKLTGLPQGSLAVHIHETGACDGPDFQTAGGHLAVEGQDHGVMAVNGPHVGDLPNIHVPASGDVTVEYFAPDLSVDLLMDDDGSAFMIHAHADDHTSQPAGDAGTRIACGVFKSE
ncbi:superoxide dismutase family protein [Paracoccus sp. (in: a-proteobacteria)]|uniref:superoxide dismutase family protein n=1 Tax=Paracoccus sp. TaxID=267 RepID=UPI0026DFBB4A|nr:superoxide dismutase family protein [Paracoccus sp. (in: a-proteobacteria)]MDO5646675.1 superoxide dismutase family protein [Paracoccus sp. (in: a-proteobacteria)]